MASHIERRKFLATLGASRSQRRLGKIETLAAKHQQKKIGTSASG
jgi:hypothetical protein